MPGRAGSFGRPTADTLVVVATVIALGIVATLPRGEPAPVARDVRKPAEPCADPRLRDDRTPCPKPSQDTGRTRSATH